MAYAEITFPTWSGQPVYTQPLLVEVMQGEFMHEVALLHLPVGVGLIPLVDEQHLSGAPVQIEYGSGDLNAFFLGYVDRTLPQLGEGAAGMRLACVGASYPMKQARQKVWTDVAAPQVAVSLAGFYGFDLEVEDHPRIYPQILQTGESDWSLLVRLAKDIGFTFYVRGTTLHFHSSQWRLAETLANAQRLVYDTRARRSAYLSDTTANLAAFTPTLGEAGRKQLVTAGVDPALGIAHEVVHDGVSTQLGAAQMDPIFTEYTRMTAPSLYEADQALAGQQETNRWYLTADAEARGSALLKPATLANVQNVPDSYAGLWWVCEATHRFTSSAAPNDPVLSYKTLLQLGRDGLEGADSSTPPPQTRFLYDQAGPQGAFDRQNTSVLTESGQWISTTLGLVRPAVDTPVPDYITRRLDRVDG